MAPRTDDSQSSDATALTIPEVAGAHAQQGSVAGYELREHLGQGGMGEVLLAHDAKMGRDVALKRMRDDTPSDEAIERFLREARIQARLDHPAIVPVHDLGRDVDNLPYFTMKRLTGKTLLALLAEDTFTVQRALRAFVDVCLAIDLAHTRRIIHRDLKPSNIMLGDYGEVYVLDWGVARVLSDRELPSSANDIPSVDGQTKAGQLLGTPGYMAPEQVRGEDLGPPADVYALGSILFEILARQPLHPRGSGALASTLDSIDVSPRNRARDRDVAPELDSICTRALAEDPAKRPTARQIGDEIQAYLDGDRDVEHRRALAAEMLASAKTKLAAGDRAEAVHAAGRALALDPTATAASDFLVTLLAEPPKVLPAELVASLHESEQHQTRERSKRAIFPFLMLFLVVPPSLPFVEIRSWSLLVACFVVGGVIACLSYVNWKIRHVPIGIFVVAQLAFITLFSRLSSPFVLTPMLIAGILLAITSVPWINDRKWFVVVFATVASLLAFGLEQIGVFAQSWSMSPNGIVMHSTVFSSRTWVDVFMFVLGNTAMAIVLGIYALGFARDRRAAHRAIHVHAWHLQQLLPRAVRSDHGAAR